MNKNLTPREQDVAKLLATGYTAPEVARELHISVRTVESHRVNIYGKLGVTSRRELYNVIKPGQNLIIRVLDPSSTSVMIGFELFNGG